MSRCRNITVQCMQSAQTVCMGCVAGVPVCVCVTHLFVICWRFVNSREELQSLASRTCAGRGRHSRQCLPECLPIKRFDVFEELSAACVMLRVFRKADQLLVFGRPLTSSATLAFPQGRTNERCDVPEGHRNSDLRKSVCHIGLNRRRDLSLREDLCLFRPGSKATVKEIFGVRCATVMFC